jgi:uncharacterized membrane protein YccC
MLTLLAAYLVYTGARLIFGSAADVAAYQTVGPRDLFPRLLGAVKVVAGLALLLRATRRYAIIGLAIAMAFILLGPREVTDPWRQWGEPIGILAALGIATWLGRDASPTPAR